MNLVTAALKFYSTFASSLASVHSATLHHLSTLLLPSHVQNDDLAQRFRDEKYAVRMSRSGFGLLVGWLTEGVGGEAAGAGEGFSGERGKRGRAAVMRVVNNHLQFDGICYFSLYLYASIHSEYSNCLEHKLCICKRMGGIHRAAIILDPASFWSNDQFD